MGKSLQNFIYNSIYHLLVITAPLITTPYISRVLGAENIGIYSYSYSIAYYFVMFILLGLNNYGNRTIAMVRNDKKELSKTFLEIYAMQLSVATVMIIAYCIYTLIFSNTTMSWIMLIYVISGALDVNWLFFGLEEFKLTVTRNIIIKVLTTCGIFLFVKSASDVYWYGLIMTGGMLASQIAIWPFVRKNVSFCRIEASAIKRHLKPNLVLFIPVVAVSIYKFMDKIMLGSLSNMEQVGFYENADKIVNVPMALVNALGNVMLPRMSNLIANNKKKEAETIFSKSIMLAMFCSTSMCFGTMGLSEIFVPWFYGDGYDPVVSLFKILLPSCIFLAFANVIRTQYLIPNKKDKIYMESVILGAIVNLLTNAILIPRMASIGAAVGTLCAEAIVCIWQTVMIRKEIDAAKYVKQAIPFVCAGVIMYVVLLVLPDFGTKTITNIIVKTVLGAVVYLLLISCCMFANRKKKSFH